MPVRRMRLLSLGSIPTPTLTPRWPSTQPPVSSREAQVMVSDGLFQDTAWGSLCLWLQSSMDPCDQLHMGSLQ